MMNTMEKITEESLLDFKEKNKRIDWIENKWPGQIIQVVDQIIWTNRVENAILKHKENALNKYLLELEDDVILNFNKA